MKLLVLSLALINLVACRHTADPDKEKREIQAQIDLIDSAHHTKDARLFLEPNADSWIDIRNGTISRVNKSDMLPSLQSYLHAMEFQEIIKRDEPVIEISDDGTLASHSGSATVKGLMDGSPMFWLVSWQNVLRKIDGEWKIVSSANTEADERSSAGILLDRIRLNLGIGKQDMVSSIYAMAECKGPLRSFQTLVLSRESDGKMEQIYDQTHLILKHGKDGSWSYNPNNNQVVNNLDEATKSLIAGHELHWLSMWPEHRYSNALFRGITRFNDQAAFHIEMKNKLNGTIDFYYSFDSYYPLGFESHTGDGIDDGIRVLFENWEKIDGISVFKTATLKHGDEVFEYDFSNIRLNQLDDDIFNSKQALLN